MKILIIQTAFIGDVILATPIIEKLHRFYPEAVIDVLVRKGNEALLKNHPFIHQVLIWNKKESKYKNFYKILIAIRLEKYDLVVNVQRFLSTGILSAFSGAKSIVGFRKNPMSFLFNKKLPHELNGIHEVDRNLSLVQHLTDNSSQMPKLYPTKLNFEKAQQIIQNQSFVTIAPTSVWFTKQLPAEKWIALIHRFSKDISIFLIGGPGDFGVCENIKNNVNSPNIFNLCGKLNLLESAALMSKAMMNYANDSSPIHIASAMNAPITAVFCSTVPKFGFTPLSDNRTIVESKHNLDCRPCGLHGKKSCPKGHFKCADVDWKT